MSETSKNTNTNTSGHGPGRRGGHGGPRGMMPEKAKDFKGSVKKLLGVVRPYRIGLILVMLFAIGSTIFNIVGPRILALATNELFSGLALKLQGLGGIDFAKVGKILLFLLGLYVVSASFSFVQGWIMSTITQKMSYQFRRQLSEKIHRMPMNYFESRTHGEVLSRITNDVDTLGHSLSQSITTLITSITTMVGVLIMMLSISPLMTLIALVILPISAVLVMFVMKRSQKYFRGLQKYLGELNGQVEENFGGLNVVKAFNREDEALAEFEAVNEKLYQSAWRSQFLSGMMQPVMNFVGNLGYVGVAISGSVLAIRGAITVGDIQAFIQYVKSFTQPISQMAQVMNMIQSMAAAAERVFEFLEEEEEDQVAANHAMITEEFVNESGHVETFQYRATVADLKGQVTFENVHFGYTPDKIIINDFSTSVQPGQTVAIVGPTGAGKTTMVKLLMRFYDVNSGRILIDGHDVRDFDRSELREVFGMVLQDTWLFKGTIMENIRYGRQNATDEEVIRAAKAAHAHHFIQTLPGGYQMELNEEATNVSQGQKQLLTIARTILANNKILILDEATSSVDTRTEQRIQSAMNNLMKGRTSFVIAHRLSTIKDADMILVMKDGDIVEQGNHEELLAKDGFYAQLYNSQFEDAGE
ncbi:MAG: ABC transporter ATP-binding protein [Lachnospiraceae bacterium]|nr:ABC transporter ATP-binding protein [Lachnospiraceae bacterium]